jgi:hypothetical protein
MKIDNTKDKTDYCICGVAEYEPHEIQRNKCKDCGKVPFRHYDQQQSPNQGSLLVFLNSCNKTNTKELF